MYNHKHEPKIKISSPLRGELERGVFWNVNTKNPMAPHAIHLQWKANHIAGATHLSYPKKKNGNSPPKAVKIIRITEIVNLLEELTHPPPRGGKGGVYLRWKSKISKISHRCWRIQLTIFALVKYLRKPALPSATFHSFCSWQWIRQKPKSVRKK